MWANPSSRQKTLRKDANDLAMVGAIPTRGSIGFEGIRQLPQFDQVSA
ncbi:hypothetical protein AM1_B0055 (plasmid) [Acaryochloris marina MBIC11017]|uniref:Uncharacterized protein n=1 Tax=Acaryochloris marina (strain MBIC 11017) TaxID=329726 RepID=A8ZM12_ACAM1|nr:hypothetical protein AM1_B0055 [Acaryochloris marina MBIC11017]